MDEIGDGIPKLLVKKLHEDAIIPTVAHPGEDLGYDLYAIEDALLYPGAREKVKTGVALRVKRNPIFFWRRYGLLYRDRSSMASNGITVSGGVIDAGYSGECVVMLTLGAKYKDAHQIKRGDKIVQAIPVPILTGGVDEVEVLPAGARGGNGFGSSGR